MFENQLELYKMLKERVNNAIKMAPSIDKLMKDKVEPYVLLEEYPIPIRIGNKIIFVGNLNMINEDKFFRGGAKILGNLGLQNLFIDLLSAYEVYADTQETQERAS